MNRTTFLTFLFLLYFFSVALSQEPAIRFQTGQLEQLKSEATREEKPMFIHFTASWCMPCQWMEKNTYSDQQLASFVNEHFLPVKIDIDEREGYRAKQEYRIILLPSVLIVDSRGLVVGRYEESMNAGRLLQVLQQYAPSPSDAVLAAGKPELSAPSRPTLIVRPALVPESSTPPASSPPRKINTSAAAPPPPFPTSGVQSGMPVTDNGNLGMSSSPPRKINPAMPAASSPPPDASPGSPTAVPTGRYSIQVGVFSNYDNALRQMEDLKRKVTQPVKVFIGNMQGATIYRLLIGTFEQRSDAEAFLSQLSQSMITGMVKDIGEL